VWLKSGFRKDNIVLFCIQLEPQMKANSAVNLNAAGWSIPAWCAATSISRASFYLLHHKPRTVKLGRRTVVIEPPDIYLLRVAEAQQEAA